MKTVTISKRTLVFAALAIVAVIGVVLVVVDIERGAASARAEVEAAVETAAVHALSQALDLDYEEREAWAARVKPLCTERGWAFWGGPLFADQVWPMVNERQYTTESIEVIDARVVGEGPVPDSQVVEVVLTVTYTTAGGESEEKAMPNRIVMVLEGDRWLMDTPSERGGEQ